ncbi:MAG: hypothetical protein IIY93_04860 [Clostridia bacterium]|nr:hypothetical protein [Clostridia bacterium]MBQ1554865.1 hypothetical protein [Clostridia bacterium]MBQ4396604.1 hypothetical protein [Clostridia bacterium]
MNVIFISPNYPEDRWRYIHALRGLGVNVLGIGDAAEEAFPHGLKGCLTDYYRVDDLHDYDAVYRAVAYLTYQHGRADAIESLNDYWSMLEASLRRDFNVVGFDVNYAKRVFNRERVWDTLHSAHIALAQRDALGCLIMPEHARIIRCSGLADRYGHIKGFCTYEFSDLPSRIRAHKEQLSFFSISPEQCNTASHNLKDIALHTADVMKIRGGFFTFTFMVDEAQDSILLADASFLPPEEYFADVMACSGSSDVCHMWAADKVGINMDYHVTDETTVFATRRFDRSYRYSHDRIMSKLRPMLRRYGRCYTDMEMTGDYFYIFKAESPAKARELIRFIQVDYADSTPIAEFPPLHAVDRTQLRQSAIREQSSYDARRLLSRKVEEKLRFGSCAVTAGAYEKGKQQANDIKKNEAN